MLHGAVAAALTPLRDGGGRLDEDVVGPYVDFLAAAGLDGVLALGTNGEGILLSVEERARVTELFVGAAAGRMQVAAHCGAQTTADSVELAERAADAGADAVAVIGPPYFKLDPEAQHRHLRAVARACAPTPFYVYEFESTAGYPFDLEMLMRLRDGEENVVGMKVSDTPWDAWQRYLLDGFDIFVGPEAFIARGMGAGAVGAVSALASAFPAEVAAVVREPSEKGAAALGALRQAVERYPRQAGFKRVVARKGVPIRSDVRAPLRDLTTSEAAGLDTWLDANVAS